MKVHEIFNSISGDVGNIPQGAITTFIRTQGCNLQFLWPCDTVKTQNINGVCMELTPQQIIENVPDEANVVITSGEPLIQNRMDFIILIHLLLDKSCNVQIETNGTIFPDFPQFNSRICWVVDWKGSSSGMSYKMISDPNFRKLPEGTWIKFVIKTEEDACFFFEKMRMFAYNDPFHYAISMEPDGIEVKKMITRCYKELDKSLLSKIVFNFQIHKIMGLA